jgi:hypothetical protein
LTEGCFRRIDNGRFISLLFIMFFAWLGRVQIDDFLGVAVD